MTMRTVPEDLVPPRRGPGRPPKYDLSGMQVGEVRAVPYRDRDCVRNWLPARKTRMGQATFERYRDWRIVTWRVRTAESDELYFKRES